MGDDLTSQVPQRDRAPPVATAEELAAEALRLAESDPGRALSLARRVDDWADHTAVDTRTAGMVAGSESVPSQLRCESAIARRP